jgi:hypothetical protein
MTPSLLLQERQIQENPWPRRKYFPGEQDYQIILAEKCCPVRILGDLHYSETKANIGTSIATGSIWHLKI